MTSISLYSRDPMLKKRDDFEDMLEERRSSSDLKYAFKCYTPVLYKGMPPCKTTVLKSMVLHSDQLRYVINQVSKETGESAGAIQEEASAILEEMAHRLQLSTVRFFAFALTKAFKTLFRSIHVNEEGLQRLQQAIQDHPVVLLPSHRSYMDFLLMSYILYTYDLALPVIAAGMDFMGMKFVGEMLRMSGAFFIRRSFGGDKLYWAVFSEYVKTMLRNGMAPVEFFLEGTRSRTCKSLTPKIGLLNIVMEPFLKGEVFDVSLVPVSISYERILEESLYARELLGVPKPKESTSGLFKARKVLSEDYGSIHVYFGHAVSVRTLSEGRVDRRQFNLQPRFIPKKPSEDTQGFVSAVAYRLVRSQEENMVLMPWVLLASLLLQAHYRGPLLEPHRPQGMTLEELTQRAVWLRGLVRGLGAFLHWPDDKPPSEVVSASLSLHQGLVRVSEGRVRLLLEEPAGGPGPASPEERLLGAAVAVLSCASYRNQVLHVFLRPALLATAVHTASSGKKGEPRPGVLPCCHVTGRASYGPSYKEVFDTFSFLRNVLANEFILCPGAAVQDFEEACQQLVQSGALQASQQQLTATDRGEPTLAFLTAMLEPFLQGYQVVCRYLCEEASESLTEKLFVPAVRNFTVKLLLAGNLRHCEALSSDLQKNALAALLRLGAVRRVNGGEQVTLKVDRMLLNTLEDTLGGKVPSQKAVLARL
ncbi:dihydroxyacetone phosphate acyltransferase isoform X4 [Gadus morhua]|uniref:dihydroxyacetone phosphate acyltransferase isoform X4 n=1 Tax=Gadus morhua TaxID=8049 RepID=UPI0011B51E43|nr:dihydroxyacetone phosphate acyltransferase isoform X4 [Gadus morhua]